MPQVRKLSVEEVAKIENKGKGTRRLAEEEYDNLLADFAVGDYGEVESDNDDKRLTIRNRLKAAANRRNIQLVFARIKGHLLRFKVVGSDVNVQDDCHAPRDLVKSK